MEQNQTPVLRVEHISKHFGGVDALIDCSLELYAGEVHALVGGNGAGKSTLVSMISGNNKPSGGKIFMDEQEVQIPNARVAQRMGIATIYQNLALCNNLEVYYNVFLGNELLKKPPLGWLGFVDNKRMRKETRAALDRLHINLPNVYSTVRNLSGGQRQCIACARSLKDGARVLLMDEPTAALGVKESEQVNQIMLNCRDEGAAVMLISHNMENVMRLADRITVLRLGRSIITMKKEDTTAEQLVGYITGAIVPPGMDAEE